MRMVRTGVAAMAVVWSMMLGAQTPKGVAAPEGSALKVESKLVVVPVVVRDKKHALVRSLPRESFTVTVDGKPQVVRYFDHDSEVPLTVGLLIDTSLSQRNVVAEERAASAAFLETMLVPVRDKAFVIQFAKTVELLADTTESRPKLQAALKEVEVVMPKLDRTAGDDRDERRGEVVRQVRAMAGTALYDAVFLATDEVIAKQSGRRALVLLTDGKDHGSKVTLAKAIEAAQRANTVVYAIYYEGEGFGGGGGRGPFGGGGGPFGGGRRGGGGGRGGGRGGEDRSDGKLVLERMCGETGGRMFEVKGKQTVEKIYAEIGDELRTQYRLGFTPGAEAAAEGYHQIVVRLGVAEMKAKETVQARDGYYTK